MITKENYEVYFIDYLDGKLNQKQVEQLRTFLSQHPELQEELEIIQGISFESSSFDSDELLDDSFKHSLKKSQLPISEKELYHLFDRHAKSELSTAEQIQLNTLLQDEKVASEWQKFEKTLLTIDDTVLDAAIKSKLQVEDHIDYSNIEYLMIGHVEGDLSIFQEKELQRQLVARPELKETLAIYSKTKLVAPAIAFPYKKELQKKETKIIAFRPLLWAASSIAAAFLLWMGLQQESAPAQMANSWNSNIDTLKFIQPSDSDVVNEDQNSESQTPRYVLPESTMAGNDVAFEKVPNPIEDKEENNPQPTPENEQQHSPAPHQDSIIPIDPTTPESFDIGQQVTPNIGPDMKELFNIPNNTTNGAATSGSYTILEYAKAKTKERIWGDENYPEEKFIAAVAQKELGRFFKNNDDSFIQIQRIQEKEGKAVKVRIGKFRYTYR